MSIDRAHAEMPDVHLVFAVPPRGVPDSDFNEWYDNHIPEVLREPGFLSGQRFRLEPFVGGVKPSFPYATIYECERGSRAMHGAMRALEAGRMFIPDWHEQLREESCFASWDCIALGPKVFPRR